MACPEALLNDAATFALEAPAAADAQGFTAWVAAATAGLAARAVSATALRRAEHCVLDFFANTIAGSHDAAVAILHAALADEGGSPQAQLIGRPERAPLRTAALINGTAGHALDYDDNNLTMPGHVSVAVIPALLALAEHRRLTGPDLLTALVAGFEAGCTIGAALAPGHYERGFHATATIGTLAAAAGAAQLIGLDSTGTRRALGIAATSAAGIKGVFGTMCKPLHAGRAAEAGLLAALLAERGFTSALDSIECRQGFATTHGPGFDPAPTAPRHGPFHIQDNLFKFHAACYGTHAVIEAALELRGRHLPASALIRGITLDVAASNDTVCNLVLPVTAAEARFSLRHVAAMALLGHDTADPEAYGSASLEDPEVARLRAATSVRLVPERPITLGDVTLELGDGSRLSATADLGVPDADLDREAQRLRAKFERLVVPILGAARSAALAERLLWLGELGDLGAVTALSAPDGR